MSMTDENISSSDVLLPLSGKQIAGRRAVPNSPLHRWAACSRGYPSPAIGDFRPHPRSGALDQEVDLMTRVPESPGADRCSPNLVGSSLMAGMNVLVTDGSWRAGGSEHTPG